MSNRVRSHGKTKDIPRCPFCYAIMEEVQLKFEEDPNRIPFGIWHEVWNCSSCNTNHVFPARIEFLKKVLTSKQLERDRRILHLPRNIDAPHR